MRAAHLFSTFTAPRNRSVSEMSAFLWSGTVSGNELVNDKGTGNITITNKDFTTTIPYTSLATFSMAPALEPYDTDGFWFSSGTPLQKTVQDLVECTSQKTLVKQNNTTFEISKIGVTQGATPSPTEKTTLTTYFDLWCYHFGALNMAGYFKYNRGLQSGSYGYEWSRWNDQNNIYGVTMPDGAILSGWDAFIRELKENGLWSYLTNGYLLNSGGLQAGRLNIKDITNRTSIVNSPTFTEGEGTKSDGSGYINTGVAVNTITPTSFTAIVYVKESSTTSLSQDVFGARTNTDFTLLKFQPKTGASGGFTNGFSSNVFTNANHRGLYCMTYQTNRPVMIKDGTKTQGSVEAPSSPNIAATFLLLARNASTTSTPNGLSAYTRNVGAAFFFNTAFSDATELLFRTIFNNNKTSMGL